MELIRVISPKWQKLEPNASGWGGRESTYLTDSFVPASEWGMVYLPEQNRAFGIRWETQIRSTSENHWAGPGIMGRWETYLGRPIRRPIKGELVFWVSGKELEKLRYLEGSHTQLIQAATVIKDANIQNFTIISKASGFIQVTYDQEKQIWRDSKGYLCKDYPEFEGFVLALPVKGILSEDLKVTGSTNSVWL